MKCNRTLARCIPAATFILGLALLAPASSVFANFLATPANAASPAGQEAKDPKQDYALIFGTVWGKDGRPVYGVPIKIRRADEKKARWQLMSDHRGEFAQRVPVGKAQYIIWADIKVPKGQQKPQVTANVEYNERLDIGLHLTE